MKRYVTAIFSILLFAIFIGISTEDRMWMQYFFVNFSYYIVSFLILLWIVSLVQLVRAMGWSVSENIRKNAVGIIAALFLTLVVFLTVKTDFRTLCDETNLLSISNSLFMQKKAVNILSFENRYGNFPALWQILPRRPLVYPLFVSILHNLTGFRPENAFIANYLILFFFLTATFIFIKKYTDATSAISAMLLVISQPVVVLYAASGGFDFINAFFFFLSFAALLLFMKCPSKEKFTFVWLIFLMLSNIRYESVLAFAIVITGLLVWRYITWDTIKSHVILIASTPILMLPYIFQRIAMLGKDENLPGVPVYSFSHLYNHLKEFVQAQLDFSFYLPYANLINLVSIICIFWLFYRFAIKRIKGEIPRPTRHFIILFSTSIMSILLVILSFHNGSPIVPTSVRFYIVISLVFSFSLLWVRKISPVSVRSEAILGFAITMFFLYHPVAMRDCLTNTLHLNREFRQLREFVHSLDYKRVLLVHSRPGLFTAMGYNAIRFSHMNENSEAMLDKLNKGLYSDIIVMQQILYNSQRPSDSCEISEDFPLEKLDEMQTTTQYLCRISKVIKNQ